MICKYHFYYFQTLLFIVTHEIFFLEKAFMAFDIVTKKY